MARKNTVDVAQNITNQIIAELERGVAPWRCEWSKAGTDPIPLNAATGRPYHGINVLLLWCRAIDQGFESARWLTFQQAKNNGGHVKKGEKATPVIFYKTLEKENIQDDGETKIDRIPLMRQYYLFNIEQTEGCEKLAVSGTAARFDFTPDEGGELLIDASGIGITHGGARACYRPATDTITLPDQARFEASGDYYATAAHELIHATKHKTRCDRPAYSSQVKHGAYAFEELVAELGALFVCAQVGLPRAIPNHAAYIGSWLGILKENKRAIFKAAAQAQKATDWLLARVDEAVEKQLA